MRNQIKVIKQESRYIIRDEKGHSISVIVNGDNSHISIFRQTFFNQSFSFIGSDKATVEAIIKLFSEALKLLKS